MKQNLLGVDEAVRREVEEVTGYTLPDPNKAEFNKFVEALKVEHPVLAEKLANSLIPNVPSPYEQAAQQVKRRRGIGRVIRNLFYTEDWGVFKLNRRAIMIAILTLVTTVLGASYIVSTGINERNEQRRVSVEQERLARENSVPTQNKDYNTDLESIETQDDLSRNEAVNTNDGQADTITTDDVDSNTSLDNTDSSNSDSNLDSNSGSYYENNLDYGATDETLDDPFNTPIFIDEATTDNSSDIASTPVNDDIPPPRLDERPPLITAPSPSQMFTPYDELDKATDAVSISAPIQRYTDDAGSSSLDYAGFEGNSQNAGTTFQRESSSTFSGSSLSQSSIRAETIPLAEQQAIQAFNREQEPSTTVNEFVRESSSLSSAPLSTRTELTEQQSIQAFSREQSESQAAVNEFVRKSESQIAVSAFVRHEDESPTAVSAFVRESSPLSSAPLSTRTELTEQQSIQAFSREQSESQASVNEFVGETSPLSSAPLSTRVELTQEQQGTQTFAREQAESPTAVSAFIRETSSLSSAPLSTRTELAEQQGIQAFNTVAINPERKGISAFNRQSQTTDNAQQSLSSFNREESKRTVTLYSGSDSQNNSMSLGTDVLYTRGETLTSGDILFQRNTSDTANEPEIGLGDSDILYQRNTGSDVPFQRDSSNALVQATTKDSILTDGLLYPAQLITNAVVVEGGEQQFVIAESNNWCDASTCPSIRWVGQTEYFNGRINIVFNSVIVDNTTHNGSGVAFSKDKSQGLEAFVGDSSPTLAADMLRGVAGGVGEFADAMTNATSLITNGNFAVEEYATPEIWSFLLGGLANTVKLPDNNETNVIRTAFTEKETEFYILFQTQSDNLSSSIFR